MQNIKIILDSIVENYKTILKDNLIGIYIHGSLAMDCFNPDISDIDFLVVVKENINANDKRKLVDILLELSKDGPGKGLEMSVLLEKVVKNFKHPTPYILHYSNAYKATYEANHSYLCEDGEDPDLAAHITITRARGICIYGSSIEDIFSPVPRKDYLKSIYFDIANSREEIIKLPMYTILNLSRVLYYLKEDVICSKKEGGQWACSNLPKEYIKTVEKALNCYEKGEEADFKEKDLVNFADFIMNNIDNYFNSEVN